MYKLQLQKHNLRGQVIVTFTVVLLRTSLFSKKSSPRFAMGREVIIFPYQQVDCLLGYYLDNNQLLPNVLVLSPWALQSQNPSSWGVLGTLCCGSTDIQLFLLPPLPWPASQLSSFRLSLSLSLSLLNLKSRTNQLTCFIAATAVDSLSNLAGSQSVALQRLRVRQAVAPPSPALAPLPFKIWLNFANDITIRGSQVPNIAD